MPEDPIDHLAEFERTAAEFAAVLDRVDPIVAVPDCPGWTLADLALHIGSGQRWAASIVLSGKAQKRPEVLRTTISWADWYAGTTAALAAALRAVDPDEPCWNFAPVDQRAGFWSRRRMHETVIHLVDAVQAGAVRTSGRPVVLPSYLRRSPPTGWTKCSACSCPGCWPGGRAGGHPAGRRTGDRHG